MTVWRSSEHAPGFRVPEEALKRRVDTAQAALPPFSFDDAQAIRALVTRAGLREVRSRAKVKLSRWQSVTKAITAATAMQFVPFGELQLDSCHFRPNIFAALCHAREVSMFLQGL